MQSLTVERIKKVQKVIPKLESRLKVKISISGRRLTIRGDELLQFLALKVLRATDFGFDPDDAVLLLNDNFTFEILNMKDHSRRKNMADVRARVIGTEGKAKKTIELLTGAVLFIRGNEVGIIVDSEHLDAVTTGLTSLIQGAKHGNVFAYLEKQGSIIRRADDGDLGLREEFAKEDEI